MGAINYRELRRLYEGMGADAFVSHLTEALEQKHLRPGDFSVRQLFEATCGTEMLNAISFGKSGRMHLQEAANAVDTGAFTNITGQLVFTRIKEAYEDPKFLWPDLCTSESTTFLYGERIPGVGGLGDVGQVVGEGMEYPTVGLNEEYLDTAPLVKRGFIVPVTREIIVADRTGLLMDRAGRGAYWLGLGIEKRMQKTLAGVSGFNNYKRNSVATNTYLTSGAYVNQQSNTLINWRSYENAELLWDAMTDPNTGELISIGGTTLIVPTALKRTALRIVGATNVAHVDNTVASDTIRTYGENPLTGTDIKVLSNSHVKEATSSSTTWFAGDPKRAFLRKFAWDIETLQAASNNMLEFNRDIWQQFKTTLMDQINVIEPRYMTKNT